MRDYKLVPVEPAEEMLRAACDEEQRPLPMWTRMKSIYRAMLAEAPVINIVATKNEQGQIVSVTLQDEDHRILEVIAEADVKGEYGDDSAAVRMDKQCREAVADALGFIRGGNYAWSYLLQQIKDITSVAEAQQPTPDVAGLVEALTIARDYVFSSLEEKKLALAGYPQMWRCEQDDLAMIDATLSAYRKETSHDK